MMAGLALGGAVGQNIAGTMNNVMPGNNANPMTPPPLPVAMYHVALNGQATGPYDINTLAQMAASGQLTANSLVWKQGMPNWIRADLLDELKALFVNTTPPIIPDEK